MKYSKTLILAYILPFIVAVNGCQNSTKQESPKTQNMVISDENTPPTTDNEKEPRGITLDKSDLKTQQDGSFQPVNYQHQNETFPFWGVDCIRFSGASAILLIIYLFITLGTKHYD